MSSASKKRYYKKRPGCATLSGPLYEIKLAALLYLRGINSGFDFQLATNVVGAGALDDVVFRYKTPGIDGHWVTCFIQTKHTKRAKLSVEMLTSKDGDFALPKYFKAYEEIRKNMASKTDCDDLFGGDIENCIFALFTNKESNADLESASVEIPERLADFLTKSGSVLRFTAERKTDVEREVMKCIGDGQDQRNFLEKLVVFCGQPKECELGGLIKAELENVKFNAVRRGVNIDQLCDSFVANVRDWCENKNNVLNNEEKESDILHMARDNVLAATCYHQERKNNTVDVSFKDAALLPVMDVLKEAFSVLLVETCECRLSATKLLEAFKEPYSILSLEKLIENLSSFALEWRQNKDKFIVLCVKQLPNSMNLESFIEKVRNVYEIAKQSQKQVVIVSELESSLGLAKELAGEFKDEFAKFQDTFQFSQLDESSQEFIHKKAVLHQGYETTLLHTISDYKQLDKILDALSVIEIVDTDNRLVIGPELADEITYYIPRFGERATAVKDSILQVENLAESIAIMVSSVDDIKTLLMRIDKTISDEQFDEKVLKLSQSVFVSNNECNELMIGEQFVLGTKKCKFIRQSHWKEDEFVLRVYSEKYTTEEQCPGCFLFVFKEINKDDIFTLSEFCQVKHYLRYDEQSLQWTHSNGGNMEVVRAHIDDTNISVLDQNTLSGLNERLILLSAEPGMGKSTLMTHLAKQAKENSPFIWTIAVSLCDQTTLFAEKAHEDVSEFLSEASGISSHLHKRLFKFALEVTGNVVVFLDGYDEVTPKYVNECGLLLSNLLKTKAKKIWISSRSSFQTQLEDHLSTLAVRIRKFNETDQRNFCKGFWKEARAASSTTAISEEELDDFITRLIELLSRDIKDSEKEMLGIPLQTRMMAEIYQDHVTGAVEMPTLNKMDLLQLLESFVDKKIRLDLSRQKLQPKDINYESRLEESQKRSLKKHELAALISFFGPENVRQFIWKKKHIKKSLNFIKEIKLGEYKTGIIENIYHNKPRFIHRVFTEFFVAKWFTKNFSKHTPYLEKMLYTTDFDVIRTIFDRILARNCPLHISVLNEDADAIREILSQENVHSLDLGGRTVLHLAAAYGTSKHQEEIRQRDYILHMLISRSHDLKSKKDEVLKSLPYRYADISQSWLTIEKLLPDTNGAINLTSHFVNPEDQSRLEFIFSHDFKKLMHYVLDSGLPVDHTLGDTGQRLLSRACYRGSYRVVEALIERNANINRLDNEDESPLHIASKRGDYMIVQILCSAGSLMKNNQGHVTSDIFGYINARDKHGRTALHLAAYGGHLIAVQLLLHYGADYTIRDEIYGCTPLHHIAVNEMGGDCEDIIARIMPQLNASKIASYINTPSNDGETALHWAAGEGVLSAVTALRNFGGRLDQVNSEEETPLMQAAANGHADVVSYLIESYRGNVKTYINMQDLNGLTALHKAAMYGHPGVAVILFNHGANFSHRDCNGETCLHAAATYGYQDVVKDILEAVTENERNEFANLTENFGKTALDLAILVENKEVVEVLDKFREESISIDQLPNMVENEKILQGKKVDKSSDTLKHMCLQVAAGSGSNDLVTNLIEAEDEAMRVDYVNGCDENGNTALHWAANNDLTETVGLLIKSGANVDSLNRNNQTPLTLAACEGNVDAIKLILVGYDETDVGNEAVKECAKEDLINSRDKNGWTSLHHASNEGHTDALAFLIDQGGDIRAISKESRSIPLHFGAEEGHSSVVNVLVNACPVGVRADYVNTRDKFGDTALLLAVANTSVETVDLLVKAGSDISQTNDMGKTALMIASESSNHEIVKCLLESFVCLSQTPTDSDKENELLETSKTSAKLKYIHLKDKDGLTALHLAASACNKDVVVSLIKHGADLRIRGGIDDSTPLHLACESKNYSVVEALLESVPNEETSFYLNSVDSDGNTALHLAACEDSVEIVSLLIKSGSSMFVENRDKNTPLGLAALNGQLEVIKCILESCIGAKFKVIDDTNGTSDFLKCPPTIIRYIGNRDSAGVNALGHAVSEGHVDVVKYLINLGAEIDSDFGNYNSVSTPTLLHKAAEDGNAGIVTVLLDTLMNNNRNRNIPCHKEWHANHGKWESTLVHFSIKDDYIDKRDYDRRTALYLAVEAGSLECVSHIVTAGADIAKGGDDKQTPLMIAASNGNLEIVKYLVDICNKEKNGFDKRDYILMRDKHRRTAIEFAKEASRSEVLDFLKEFFFEQMRLVSDATRRKKRVKRLTNAPGNRFCDNKHLILTS